ncbi:hypothetical protein Moror_2135 [Moniliophthora roreri MCA 2997]|uniref:HMG box domain-containing protein n=1 Tax=Moniliophthora roreri (strain MCA 2997) TaxID=1381753 RepID=V2WA78_MONRO|nr:hypothetical protein Moror_2135 [Moniliophthora roreri MCA 2997]
MTIRGWTPLQSDGDDDQGVSSDTQSCQMITFNARNPEQSVHSYKSACSPESSSSSVSGVFEATPESPRPRKGDPGWVARPRNAFFIFRCNFIQDHSRGGRKATVASPSTAEKTLSKRAGEAWRSLTTRVWLMRRKFSTHRNILAIAIAQFGATRREKVEFPIHDLNVPRRNQPLDASHCDGQSTVAPHLRKLKVPLGHLSSCLQSPKSSHL